MTNMKTGHKTIPMVVDAVHNGISVAQEKYVSWSGGNWLWLAPEYLMTVAVAEELFVCGGAGYVTLEDSVRGTLANAGGVKAGAPKKSTRISGRCDIILWHGNGSPKAAIEIKNQISGFPTLKNDIARLEGMLEKKSSTLSYGVCGYSLSRGTSNTKAGFEKLESKISSINHGLSEHGDLMPEFKYSHSTKISRHKQDAWCSGVLLISRNDAS